MENINEELQLRAAILDKTSDAVILMDLDYNFLYANDAAVELYGYSKSELMGMNLRVLYPPEEQSSLENRLKEGRKKGEMSAETMQQRKDNTLIPVEVNSHRIHIGQKAYIVSVTRNITRRRKAQEKIRESEEKYRLLLENANELIAVAQDGRIKFFNNRLLEITGYSAEEMTSTPFLEFIYPEDRAMVEDRYRRRVKGEVLPSSYEFRVIRKDGEIRWAQMKVALISWEGRPAVLNMFTDITEERQLREEKEQFTKKLIKVQEEERNRISRELHDDTAQWLALLTLEMDDIVARGGELPKDIISRLQKLRETTEKALKEVRRFSHELRPSVLEHFGLTAALELIISEFNTADPAAKTDIRLKITGKDRRLSEEIELVLFRIAQESLSNIRKHSRATRALVSLHYSDEMVGLTVTDNGRGFDTGKKTADPMGGGLGLVGMRERANIIGGKFYLRSIPGKRTTVSVRVPIPRTEEN